MERFFRDALYLKPKMIEELREKVEQSRKILETARAKLVEFQNDRSSCYSQLDQNAAVLQEIRVRENTAPGAHSTASEMSLPSSSTSTTSIMGRMKRAPFFRAKWDPSRLPRMLLTAQGMPMWNTTRPFIR